MQLGIRSLYYIADEITINQRNYVERLLQTQRCRPILGFGRDGVPDRRFNYQTHGMEGHQGQDR